jgi:hypothetical protein
MPAIASGPDYATALDFGHISRPPQLVHTEEVTGSTRFLWLSRGSRSENIQAIVRYSSSVIVWISSFPRSGNTFLRIVQKHHYGVRTSVVYDVDGVSERLGRDMVGFTERPASIEVMRESSGVHFLKTHRQRDD